ncbi:MAG: hypothetical protein QNJ68_21555 [Microcoleaceae cyanobacterium MO_207.B10]|nr:hypothetical protein [Microcoleaceae cyanobacterium MO_207.B10]
MDYQSSKSTEYRVGLIDPLKADRKSNTWYHVKFQVPFSKDKKVVVIPMTQTYNGIQTPGLRIRNVSPEGFEIRFDEIVGVRVNQISYSSDGNHADEVVGWAAFGFIPD